MLRTSLLKKTKTITFTAVPELYREYLHESFEYIHDEDTDSMLFIDWLNDGKKAPVLIGSFEVNEPEYDLVLFGKKLTTTLKSYVEQKLLQKLNIHQNELNYRYENTTDIGIPYLEKKNSRELDLFIKEAIIEVAGVKEITKYTSRLETIDNKNTYVVKFEVTTENGETLWRSIEI